MEDLALAARVGNIDTIYQSIAKNPRLLEEIDDIPFENTPLHIAAEAGCTDFAMEIMQLKSSFGRKLNPDGLSPIHVALRNGHTETVRRLVENDSELIRVKGKNGWTALHYVAHLGDIDLLAQFLIACPSSINDLTTRKESAVHIAAASGCVGALRVLVGWAERSNNLEMLNWKDANESTVLHIVASSYQLYANDLLLILGILHKKVAIRDRNSDGSKALDIILRSELPDEKKEAAKLILQYERQGFVNFRFANILISPQNTLEKLLRFEINMRLGLSIDMVNALLVVAALVVTTTYQVALEPPKTTSTLHNNISTPKSRMVFFLVLNTLTFYLSTGIIFCLLKITFATVLVHLSLLFLCTSYISLLDFHNTNIYLITLCTYICLINYHIVFCRIILSLFELDGFPPSAFILCFRDGIISRLQMQHLVRRNLLRCNGH